jgi:hypothetical protein
MNAAAETPCPSFQRRLESSDSRQVKTLDSSFRWNDGKGCSGSEAPHLLQAAAEIAFGDLQNVGSLQVDPELRTLPEGTPETQRQFSGHRPLFPDDVRDAHGRHADRTRKRRLAHVEAVQDFLQQFAGMDGRKTVDGGWNGHDCESSVVINDLDIKCVTALEAKAQPPLVVDADASLAGPIPTQKLQPVGGRLAQVSGTGGDIEVPQAGQRTAQDVPRQPPGRSGREQPFRFLVGEAPDHPVTPVGMADDGLPSINNMFTLCNAGECAHV